MCNQSSRLFMPHLPKRSDGFDQIIRYITCLRVYLVTKRVQHNKNLPKKGFLKSFSKTIEQISYSFL